MQMRGFKAAVLVPVQQQEDLIGRRRARGPRVAERHLPAARSVGSGKRAREEPGPCQARSAPSPQGAAPLPVWKPTPGGGVQCWGLGAGDPAFPRAELSLWSAPGSPKMLAEKRIVSVL